LSTGEGGGKLVVLTTTTGFVVFVSIIVVVIVLVGVAVAVETVFDNDTCLAASCSSASFLTVASKLLQLGLYSGCV
jgi:hypothetical protein